MSEPTRPSRGSRGSTMPTSDGRFITRIGSCVLPDGPGDEVRGHWVTASCAEYTEAVEAAGGTSALHVWSSLTDLDGQYGHPFVFTCWGTDDEPIGACGGPPGSRSPCDGTHAVFVPIKSDAF